MGGWGVGGASWGGGGTDRPAIITSRLPPSARMPTHLRPQFAPRVTCQCVEVGDGGWGRELVSAATHIFSWPRNRLEVAPRVTKVGIVRACVQRGSGWLAAAAVSGPPTGVAPHCRGRGGTGRGPEEEEEEEEGIGIMPCYYSVRHCGSKCPPVVGQPSEEFPGPGAEGSGDPRSDSVCSGRRM